MLDKIKQLFEFSSKVGVFMPAAYDKRVDGPSVSLWFAHISFTISMIIIICLAFKDVQAGTIAAMMQSALMLIFYLIRALNKVNFNLKDKSIDLQGDNNEKDTK